MTRRLIATRALLALAGSGALPASARVAVGRRGATRAADPGALVGTWKRVVTQPDIDRTASFREEPQGWVAPVPGP